jgi:hypothetical protein
MRHVTEQQSVALKLKLVQLEQQIGEYCGKSLAVGQAHPPSRSSQSIGKMDVIEIHLSRSSRKGISGRIHARSDILL